VLSFFVTPLGDFSKLMLNRWFAMAPTIIKVEKRGKILDYNWRLKDEQWKFISFEEAQNQVVFITFWRTWHLPSKAQLKDVQRLYDAYKGHVKFYIITNEERTPVELFMEANDYTFPVTYEIVGDPSPLTLLKPPGSYILDKNGAIAIHQNAIANWDTNEVYKLLDTLIAN